MAFGFTNWDSDKGTLRAGTIYRASSSNDKVWGEENNTTTDLPYGVFVAVNPDGGVKPISAATDVIHGIVVRDIYGDKAPTTSKLMWGTFPTGIVLAQPPQKTKPSNGAIKFSLSQQVTMLAKFPKSQQAILIWGIGLRMSVQAVSAWQ